MKTLIKFFLSMLICSSAQAMTSGDSPENPGKVCSKSVQIKKQIRAMAHKQTSRRKKIVVLIPLKKVSAPCLYY